MRRHALGFAALAPLAGLVLTANGCSDEVRSCDLETSAIAMRVTVRDDDRGLEIEILVEVGSEEEGAGTPLELCPGEDKLTVNGLPVELKRALGRLYYTAEFPSFNPEFDVLLERKDFEDAELSVVMPPPMDFLAPEEDSVQQRNATLLVEWDPDWPDHDVELSVEDQIGSGCITGLGYSTVVADSGLFEIPAGYVFSSNPGQTSCAVSAVLTRTGVGEVSSTLHPSSSISAYIKRRRPFISQE